MPEGKTLAEIFMEPTILFTSDWQCHLQNLDRCELALQQVLALVAKHGVTHVVNLGDIKDSFNPVDQRVTNFLVHMTHRICEVAQFIVLAGNHDHIGVNDASPTCLPVLAAAGATTIEAGNWSTKPEYSLLELGNLTLQMVPFYRDHNAFLTTLLPPRQRARTILCFNQDLLGSRSGNYTSKDGVDTELLGGYRYAIGGHIHTPQSNGHVYYAGSPFAQDWGEVNQQKRFLLLEAGKVTSIPSTVPGYHDPALGGYQPESWAGCRVRLTNDHTDLKVLQKKYPGAELVIVPEKPDIVRGGVVFDPKGSDPQLLKEYLGGEAIRREARPLVPYLTSKLATVAAPNSRINFQLVSGENVLCFDKVDLRLDYPGVTLVTGVNKDWQGRSNGSGKSSLLGLPLLALFGETPKEQKHDGWANDKTTGTSKVTLTLDTTEGRQTVFRRRRPPGLEYTVGDKVHTMGSPVETQKLIERTTRLRWDVVVNSMYIGQQEVATLLAGTDKERKELFGRFLGLDRFLVAVQAVRDDLRKVEKYEQEVGSWLTASETLTDHLKIQVKQFEVTDSVADLEAANKTITVLLTRIRKQAAEEQEHIKQHEQALREVRTQQTAAIREVGALQERQAGYQREVDRIQRLKGQCPTCEQKVNAALFADRLAEAKADCENARINMVAAKGNLKGLDDAYKLAQQQVETSTEDLRELEASLWKQDRVLQDNLRKLDQAKQRESLQASLRLEQAKEKRHKQAMVALQADMELLKAAIKVVSRDGLPAFLGTTVVPKLEKAAQYYSALFAQDEIQVHFLVSDGEVDITIENRHGGRTITDQSQGERRIAGLIAAFAIREVLAPYNLLILDEPGEGLDSHNATVFAQALQEVAGRFGSLYLTTHNPFILAGLKPDRHLELIKENGISTLVEV